MKVVLARAALTAAPRPGGRRGRVRVRVRVRLRVRVREAGGAVAIELQGCCGSGVTAADLGRKVTVVVSGIDGLARRRRRRRGRRLVLGVQRVHEVRIHWGGGGGGPGGAKQAGSAPLLGRTAAGASGAAALAAWAAGLRQCCRPRAHVASEARQPRALSYWALMPGYCARRLGVAPPPSRVAGPRPAPARRRPPGLSRRAPARPQYNRRRPGRPAPLPPLFPLRHQEGLSAPGQEKKCAGPRGHSGLGLQTPALEGKEKKKTLCPLPPLTAPPPRPLPATLAPAAEAAAPVRTGETFSQPSTARRSSVPGARNPAEGSTRTSVAAPNVRSAAPGPRCLRRP
ncbi:myb-related transcription factor, partner of profilin-like [Aotus nancymaae]|uniref:myb-related transcription factor, partner of profilin-like n=1 Tax=Aotus nancymaae TaxID=37293 RepID=UPI0030FE5F96